MSCVPTRAAGLLFLVARRVFTRVCIILVLVIGLIATCGAERPLFCGIHKGRVYLQSGAAAPVPTPANSWFFGAVVEGVDTNQVSSAEIVSPLVTTQALRWDSFAEMYSTNRYFQTQSALDATFPSGEYSVFLFGKTNHQSVGITLGPDDYPSPLTVSNLASTQEIQADADFVLGWTSENATNSEDRIRLYVMDMQNQPVWMHRRDNHVPSHLTSTTLPANALQPGCQYKALLMYIHVIWSAQEPELSRDASYYASTLFYMKTRPRILDISPEANGAIRLRVAAPSYAFSVLEASTNLFEWQGIRTNPPSTTPLDLFDHDALKFQSRFYRLHLAPEGP